MTEKGPVMSDEIERLYGHAIKLHELEPHYCRHVQAMTAEGLHGKSDIAAELAWRDRRIDKLKADVGTMLELLANRDKDFASLQAERDALRVSLDDKVAEYTLGRVAWRVWNERIATERDAALARVEAPWVPVSMRLPPADGCLRLLFLHNGFLTSLVLGERVGDEWRSDDEVIVENVTHWMELPVAPRGP